MPITVIPNQPINLSPYVQDECLTGDNKAYTPLYNTGDALYVQMINTPCGSEQFCNTTFLPNQAANEMNVINANFDFNLIDWTPGANWTWDASGGALLTYAATGTLAKRISQTSFDPIVTGMTYTINFTIVANTSTTGLSISVGLGSVYLGSYSTPGTYSVDITADGSGSDISFNQNAGTNGTLLLDTISMYGVTDCITAIGTGWAVESGGMVHSAGTASDIECGTFFVTTETPGYFVINVTVEDMTAGSVTIRFQGDNTGTITANGVYTFYNLAFNGDDLFFGADVNFDGRITTVSVLELARDYNILLNDDQGSTVVDLVANGNVTYVNDRIVVAITLNGVDTSIGCFQIVVGDPCTSTTYTSNIFYVNTEHPCAKLIRGSGSGTSLGFLWGGFYLSHRVRFLSFNPEYPIEGDDYEFSDGTRSATFAKREKYWTGLIDYVDETTHDTISAQIICPTFTIDGVAYFVKQEGYKPKWDTNGQQTLAQANIELRKVAGTLYSK